MSIGEQGGEEQAGASLPVRHDAAETAELDLAAKRLELRLKELDIQNKEYEITHRPSPIRTAAANPAVIAALIAGWVTVAGAALTWLSGRISAATQQQAAIEEARLQRLRFESDLILNSVRTGDPDQAATNLQFLVQTGLLSGDRAEKIKAYLIERKPGQGRFLPPR
jgi:hypothetical protein